MAHYYFGQKDDDPEYEIDFEFYPHGIRIIINGEGHTLDEETSERLAKEFAKWFMTFNITKGFRPELWTPGREN